METKFVTLTPTRSGSFHLDLNLEKRCILKKYRVIINDCPIAVGVENPHKFWMCRTLATLDKLVDRFPLPPVSPP
jgi:hypothetical protein